MNPAPKLASTDVAASAAEFRQAKARKWKMFWLGLGVRLLGVLCIILGDGSPSVARKALVIVGLVLSVGGIAVLRYLLISGFRRKR